MKRRWLRWVIGAVVVVVLAMTLGPFVYIHFIEPDPPPRLQVTAGTTPTTGASSEATSDSRAPLAGTWTVGSGSQAGYRVNEVLFGQDNTAVGRTAAVTGSM